MIYRAIGVYVHSGVTTISFAEFHENAGAWTCELKENSTIQDEGIHTGKLITQFIEEKKLQYRVALISVYVSSSNHLFSGAAIAAETELPVITDLPEIDLALGGNGDFFPFATAKLQLQTDALNDEVMALCVAFMGILRWREEYNFLSSSTGASRNSIGGAIWMGQEA